MTKTSKGHQKSKSLKVNESKPSNTSTSEESRVPIELQQRMLNIFKHAFPGCSGAGADSIKPILQEVKQALFERDFERAFGREDYLEAYTFRWSPSRALCYISIFVDLRDHLSDTLLFRFVTDGKYPNKDEPVAEEAEQSSLKNNIHVACLGGGAAEVVAFGGLLKYLAQTSNTSIQKTEEPSSDEAMGAMKMSDNSLQNEIGILLLDIAAWGDVIHKLSSSLTTPPPLSKYASASAKSSNTPLLPTGTLHATFQRSNLLSMTASQLKESLGQQPLLVTLLFTLNELYTSSIAQTTAFLLDLTAASVQGTMLLVVDSPGSYSEAVLGKDRKKYPMQWLMDRTLLGDKSAAREEEVAPGWKKLVSDESRWFRMPEELKYPISVENMRYQIHLFRRL